MSATASTHIGRSGVPRNAAPVLKYVPTEYGYQDVFWQGERIGMVKRKGRSWIGFTASGAPADVFGTRRAAGAHLRRLIEGRRSA
jgi:hypothetical protein